MKNTYEKNDITSAKKNFAGIYIGIMLVLLYFTDILNRLTDISIKGLTVLRSIIFFISIILLARLLTKNIINKFQITKSYSDNLRFNINLIIIAVALLSLFYFLFAVSQNVKEIKDSSNYKTASLFLAKDSVDEIVEEAAKQARKSFIIVWISIMTASAIVVGTDGKYIEHLCFDDSLNKTI